MLYNEINLLKYSFAIALFRILNKLQGRPMSSETPYENQCTKVLLRAFSCLASLILYSVYGSGGADSGM
jgi:hypothetical protein